MIISDRTISLLKNFSVINPSIVLKPGKLLSTISEDNMFYAEAQISEDIPYEIGIHDLKGFIRVLEMDKKAPPSIDWGKKSAIIKAGNSTATFEYNDTALIDHPSGRMKNDKPPEASFNVDGDDLRKYLKMATSLKLDRIRIAVGEDGASFVALKENSLDMSAAAFTAHEYAYDDIRAEYFVPVLFIKRLYPIDYSVRLYEDRCLTFSGEDILYLMIANKDSVIERIE